jgi:TonB family protein
MFDILLESRPSALGLPRWGIVLAVGLHAAAIGAALRSPTPAPPEPAPIILGVFPFEPVIVRGGGRVAPVPALPDIDPRIPVLPQVDSIGGIPDPAAPAPIGSGVPGVATPTPGETGDSAALPVSLVQERPELLAGPPPVYPPFLREAGVEGLVVVQVVVDTLGRPERGSARIVQHAAPGFEASALSAIRAARFRPARVWGRAVRVLVDVPVAFRLHR